ncbi:MAG: hypothetical protein KC656_04910, partial [Myxococcales bacterium]|nr:hypothetical protein [Myxococcales bacterium]
AAKFTRNGEIRVSAEASDDRVDLRVTDTGVGIPEDQQERIFERFEQGDASRTKVYGGVGLGLAITRKLVERMGGTIDVSSTPGAGATFIVRLRRA